LSLLELIYLYKIKFYVKFQLLFSDTSSVIVLIPSVSAENNLSNILPILIIYVYYSNEKIPL